MPKATQTGSGEATFLGRPAQLYMLTSKAHPGVSGCLSLESLP